MLPIMPRYFIDLHDGGELLRDQDGYELPDLEAARAQAVRIMTRIAQGLADQPGRQDYVAAVRDAEGAVRWRYRMLVRLSDDHDDLAGMWFLEAGFGRVSTAALPLFADIDKAQSWIEQQLKHAA